MMSDFDQTSPRVKYLLARIAELTAYGDPVFYVCRTRQLEDAVHRLKKQVEKERADWKVQNDRANRAEQRANAERKRAERAEAALKVIAGESA